MIIFARSRKSPMAAPRSGVIDREFAKSTPKGIENSMKRFAKLKLLVASALIFPIPLALSAEAQVVPIVVDIVNCPNSHHVIHVDSFDDGKHNTKIDSTKVHTGDEQSISCASIGDCYLEFSSGTNNKSETLNEVITPTLYVHVHENNDFTISDSFSLCE